MLLRESAPRWKVAKEETTVPLEVLLNQVGELHQFIDAAAAHRARSYLSPRLPPASKEDKRNAPRLSWRKTTDIPPYRPRGTLTAKEQKKRLLYEKAWLRAIQSNERLSMTLGHNMALSKNYSAYREKAKKIHWSWNLDANSRVAMAALLRIARWEKLAAQESEDPQ